MISLLLFFFFSSSPGRTSVLSSGECNRVVAILGWCRLLILPSVKRKPPDLRDDAVKGDGEESVLIGGENDPKNKQVDRKTVLKNALTRRILVQSAVTKTNGLKCSSSADAACDHFDQGERHSVLGLRLPKH
jgi:hypothetical protein